MAASAFSRCPSLANRALCSSARPTARRAAEKIVGSFRQIVRPGLPILIRHAHGRDPGARWRMSDMARAADARQAVVRWRLQC
jgi:hypothetical protein